MSSAGHYLKAGPFQATRFWGNMFLALFKGVLGWLSGSKALLADALRSGTDAIECSAPLFQSRLAGGGKSQASSSAKDHSRKERPAAVLVSVALLVIGLEICISAIQDIAAGAAAAPEWYSLPAIIAAAAIRGAFARSGERLSGLFCAFTAFIGAGGALAGELLSIPALYYFDPAAAIVIAVIVMHKGYSILSEEMAGKSKPEQAEEDPQELKSFVDRIEGVISVQSLKAREHGHYVVAEVVISVNPRISVLEGNDIAKRVKLLMMKRFVHITDVQVYVEPYDPGYPYKSNHDPNQEQMPTLLQ